METSKLLDLRCDQLRALVATVTRLKSQPGKLHFKFPPRCSTVPFIVEILISDGVMAVHRSSTAETLAAMKEVSRDLYIRELLLEIRLEALAELNVDSNYLQSLSKSVKDPEERLNKVNLAAIQNAIDDGNLEAANWFPDQKMLANVLENIVRLGQRFLTVLSTERTERSPNSKTNHQQAIFIKPLLRALQKLYQRE